MITHGHLLLRDLANAGESVRLALERAGLDYCCEGEQSLECACARAGVDPGAVEAALSRVPPRPADEWAHRGLTELLDHIVRTVHPRTRRLFDELAACAASLPTEDGSVRELREAIDLLVSHATLQMAEEEQVLFARARALADARKARGPFPPMLRTIHHHLGHFHEGHATTHEHLRRVRTVAGRCAGAMGESLRARIEAVARSLTEQIHLENNELIPRCLDLEPNGRDAHS